MFVGRRIAGDLVESVRRAVAILWRADLVLPRRGRWAPVFLAVALALCAMHLVPYLTAGLERPHLFHPVPLETFTPDALGLSLIEAAAVFWIAMLVGAKSLDLLCHERLTGRPFDWDMVLVLALVNVIFYHTAVFLLPNPLISQALDAWSGAVGRLPTLVAVEGPAAVVLSYVLVDFAFYWAHRLAHGRTPLWRLGHVNHHRVTGLNEWTAPSDPPTLLLDAAGGRGLSLLIVPVLAQVFGCRLGSAAPTLALMVVVDALLAPSHSVALYRLEMRVPALRFARRVLVTPAVHYTHHSSEPRHDLADGCNFGARLAIWDRLFGTYAEPPLELPRTGLRDPGADTCRNPMRYAFLPLVEEIRRIGSAITSRATAPVLSRIRAPETDDADPARCRIDVE